MPWLTLLGGVATVFGPASVLFGTVVMPHPELLKAHQSRSVGHFFQQAEDGVHGGVELLRRPLIWQEEEVSDEPLRIPLEILISLVLERLAQSETNLTRKDLRLRLIKKQKKREQMRAQQAKAGSGSSPRSPRGMLSDMLTNPGGAGLV